MDPSMEKLLQSLDQELEVNLASAEYYATMPFDERLLALLESEPATFHTQATFHTSQNLNRDFFPVNYTDVFDITIDSDTIEPLPLDGFAYYLKGSASFDSRHIIMDAKVYPDLNDSGYTTIQNAPENPDTFHMYKSTPHGIVFETLDAKGLLSILASLADIDTSKLRSIAPDITNKTVLHKTIEHLWTSLGEMYGSSKKVRTLSHEVSDEESTIREYLKVTYTDEETPDQSLIHLKLENVKELKDLDINDVHTLKLTFAQNSHTHIKQYAERLVASGIIPMHLVGIDGVRKNNGRTTQLNLNDPDVIKLFVDWFDQLVAA